MRPRCSALWGRTPGARIRAPVTDEVLYGRCRARAAQRPRNLYGARTERGSLLGHFAKRTHRTCIVMIIRGRHDLMRRLIVVFMRMHSGRAHDERHARKKDRCRDSQKHDAKIMTIDK